MIIVRNDLALALTLTILVTSSISIALPRPLPPPPLAKTQTIYQFPLGTWLENIAVRFNGQILTTLVVPSPSLIQIDPSSSESQPKPPINIATFPDATSAFGITELEEDLFYVLTGNFSLQPPAMAFPGTAAIWEVDLRGTLAGVDLISQQQPKIRKILDLPTTSLLNGLTSLGPHSNTLLAADCTAGSIIRITISPPSYSNAFTNDPTMSPIGILGVNGIHVHFGERKVYWTNSDRGLFCSAGIDLMTGMRAEGRSGESICTTVDINVDDFTFDPLGRNVYVALNGDNVLQTTSIPLIRNGTMGRFKTIAGNLNQTTLAGPTSAAFGRREVDRDVVYVSTSGGLEGPINGTVVVGGAVVGVKLRGM